MHKSISVVTEGKRGCGFRKLNGLYLIMGGPAGTCGKLPVSLKALNHCPHCGEPLPEDYGIRPSRAPRMLSNPELLWRGLECKASRKKCLNCPLSAGYETGPALLLWIGEAYYPTVEAFVSESKGMGISRRIAAVPKDFVVGETWVLLAHPKAISREVEANGTDLQPALMPGMKLEYEPGVFGVFRPSRIEVVVTGNEPDEEIEALVKRGLSPVIVNNPDRKDGDPDDSKEGEEYGELV